MPYDIVQKSPRLWWVYNLDTGKKYSDPIPLKKAKVQLRLLRKTEMEEKKSKRKVTGGSLKKNIPKSVGGYIQFGYDEHNPANIRRGGLEMNHPYINWIASHRWKFNIHQKTFEEFHKLQAERQTLIDRRDAIGAESFKITKPYYTKAVINSGEVPIFSAEDQATLNSNEALMKNLDSQITDLETQSKKVPNPSFYMDKSDLSPEEQISWDQGADKAQIDINHNGREWLWKTLDLQELPTTTAYDQGYLWQCMYNRSWQDDSADQNKWKEAFSWAKTGVEAGIDIAKLIL